MHETPAAIIAEALEHAAEQSDGPMGDPFPADVPAVPTTFIQARDDRFFPADWMVGIVRDRLGIAPVEVPGDHCVALSRPQEFVDALERVRVELVD